MLYSALELSESWRLQRLLKKVCSLTQREVMLRSVDSNVDRESIVYARLRLDGMQHCIFDY